jgi:hypothetical protein
MAFGIGIIVVCAALYALIVKGVLWKLLVGVFAFSGMYIFLSETFPSSKGICFMMGGTNFSYAAVIPAFVILMASFYTRE